MPDLNAVNLQKEGAPRWLTRQDTIVICVVVMMSFAVENTIGLLLLPLLGIPLVGGLLSAVIDALLIFLGSYLVPRRGTALLFATLLLLLSTLTPSFGPPGPYKILIGVGLGLTCEILLVVLGRKAWSYVVTIAIAFGLSIPMTYAAWAAFDIPGIEQLRSKLPLFTALYAILGAIGASLGVALYRFRLDRHEAIRRIRQAEPIRGTSRA
jgi:hypothetical protein